MERLKELVEESHKLAHGPGCAHVSTASAAALQQVRALERIATALESLVGAEAARMARLQALCAPTVVDASSTDLGLDKNTLIRWGVSP
jgi:hypothetical protein